MVTASAESSAAFISKIKDRTARVGVMALGYVGLPLIRTFWDAGFSVIGFDVDPKKIDMLQRGESYLTHFGPDFVRDMAEGDADRFVVTTDLTRLGEADAVLVCVPTPLGRHQEPDLSFIERAAENIAATLRDGQLVVLESTTYPGTTRKVMKPILDRAAEARGVSYMLAYSPEREDPGRKDHTTRTIPKLVGGVDAESGAAASALYGASLEAVVPVRSAEVAEAAKILENVYRAVNIALVNELKVILTAMGVDVWEVVEAASTKPFGFHAFYPGPGLGGHCIPIDPFYLTWAAREVGESTEFIELAGRVNHAMPGFVIERTMLALNDAGKAVRGSKILVLGLAYKPDVDDVRESPSFELIDRLRKLGADVSYHDPHVQETHAMRHYPDLPPMRSASLDESTLADVDCVLIATHHSAYDWSWLGANASLIVDTRGVMRGVDSKATVVNA
ncbi:MAG: nucleotide sugar dehydrogenase [Planctomycetota bacterium]